MRKAFLANPPVKGRPGSCDIVLEGAEGFLVRLDACAELLTPILSFLRSWPLHAGPASDTGRCLIVVFPARSGEYAIKAPWLSSPVRETSLACLLCSLSIEMVMALCLHMPSLMHMHAAAVQLPTGLYLFVGDNRAGKSSLVTRLMAGGGVDYGDDLVGISSTGMEAFSLGIPPRLRLPLPPSARLRSFVCTHIGERDERYCYLQSDLETLAPFGTRRKIDACVFLCRRRRGNAVLRYSPSSAHRLIPHCVLHKGSARMAIEVMQDLAASAPFFELEYAGLDEAADLLLSQELVPVTSANHRIVSNGVRRWCHAEPLKSCVLSLALYRRAEGVRLLADTEGAYLVDERTDAVFHLNAVSEGVWLMMEYPLSEAEAASLLQERFPDVNPGSIGRDVSRLFCEFRKAGLIEPCR